ncbi:hypothetical protein REJC140_00758 [Pseudorhizobium endolithicum]|uniref:Uncharacterized protein n=1 Tax=Pseudorhizobium endolithicum TaxID=1191678 RepID=A0ABM8PNG9_9HYPH|nr:hypothetical protein [Pseudorhizobium endolithicum]CAD7039494.1 hypothetical protein REJC140_00758 [Pseudorhizobium endolithicum]
MGRMVNAAAGPIRDVKDRLIIALYAQLKAERHTREALEDAIRSGAVSSEVLEAIAGDPVPVASGDDLAAIERVIAIDRRRRQTLSTVLHEE